MDPSAFIMLTTPPANPEDFGGFAMFMLVIMGLGLLPYYFLRSIALFRISSRRGIFKAWLSWVPIGSSWVQGCISDQYQQTVLGKTTKRRRWMLFLNALCVVSYLVLLAVLFAMLPSLDEGRSVAWIAAGIVMMVFFAVTALATAIMGWLTLYDLFCSCDPKNSGLYLVICLVVQFCFPAISIIREILMLTVSKKDLGMTPAAPPEPEPCEQNEE